jgi:hypothetical protein
MERPDADVLEQQQEGVPADEQELESIEEIPVETNEADLVDQHRVVPIDDEE